MKQVGIPTVARGWLFKKMAWVKMEALEGSFNCFDNLYFELVSGSAKKRERKEAGLGWLNFGQCSNFKELIQPHVHLW